jgi:hypothetical protein
MPQVGEPRRAPRCLRQSAQRAPTSSRWLLAPLDLRPVPPSCHHLAAQAAHDASRQLPSAAPTPWILPCGSRRQRRSLHRSLGVHLRAVRPDRASLAAVEAAVAGEALFVLLTTDYVFAEGALDRLLGAAEPAVLVDPAPDRAAWQEGCKVRILDGAAVAFGKHLDEPAIDCGAFLLPPEVFGCQRQAAAEGDHTLAGAVTRLTRARPLWAIPLTAGCWWQDVDTPRMRGRPSRRCAARSARTPTGRSAASSTGPCPPGCRCCWRRCGPRPIWCRWSRSRSAWRGRRCCRWRPRTARPPPGCLRRLSGRWGGCSAAATGGCCWWPWVRSSARPSRPWPRSRHLGAVAWPAGRLPAPHAARLSRQLAHPEPGARCGRAPGWATAGRTVSLRGQGLVAASGVKALEDAAEVLAIGRHGWVVGAKGRLADLQRPGGSRPTMCAPPPDRTATPGGGDGYGYQWWTDSVDLHASFVASGVGGQRLQVIPDLELVAVITCDAQQQRGDAEYLVGQTIIPPSAATQGESWMLDSPEGVCAGQARFEYPATSVLFSNCGG